MLKKLLLSTVFNKKVVVYLVVQALILGLSLIKTEKKQTPKKTKSKSVRKTKKSPSKPHKKSV